MRLETVLALLGLLGVVGLLALSLTPGPFGTSWISRTGYLGLAIILLLIVLASLDAAD